MFKAEDILKRFSDHFSKSSTSNLGKLVTIFSEQLQKIEESNQTIKEWRNIENAKGKSLDLIGENVNQARGKSTDEVYRVLIKSKIKRSLSDGSINTLIDFLSFILQIPPSDVVITELWPEGKYASLHVNVPGGAINQTGLTLKQFGRLVNQVVAAGVRAEVLFEGTFSFSSNYTASEMSPDGFADDAGTTGGTLGYIYDPAEDIDLPL